EITYVDEDGNTQTVTVEKGDDGKWTPKGELPDGVTVNPDTGVVTIPDEAIKGGSDVTASNSDKAGNTSDATSATSVDTDAPNPPTIDTKDDGSVTVTPADDATKTEITYVDEDGNTQTVTVEKGDDGKWTPKGELPGGVTVNPDTGVVTIPDEAIKGGSDVTASNSDKAGNTSDATSATSVDTDAPAKPTVEANNDGSITINPPSDPDTKTVTIKYTDENGNEKEIVATKDDNGKWSVPDNSDNITVNPDTGVITLPPSAVKDGSDVTAVATDNAGNSSDPATETAKPNALIGNPVLSIPEAADKFINADEISDGVQATVTLPQGTSEGAVVTLTISGAENSTVTHTVTAEEAKAGKVELVIAKDAIDTNGDYSVKADVKQGDHQAASDMVDFAVDTVVPGDTDGDGKADQAPTVTIPENNDGSVNAEDLKDGIQANVTLPEGTQAGDTVTLTVTNPDGSTSTVTHTVTEDEVAAGSAEVTIPKAQIPTDGEYSVVADIKDAAGNTGLPSEPVKFDVDATVPGDTDGDGIADTTPTVTIPEATNGVSKDELSDGVQTEVSLPKGTEAGDTVTLTVTDKDGNTSTVTHTVTQEEIDAGKADITIPKEQFPTDGDYNVVAEITDPAGNTSGKGAETPVTVDTTAPSAPVVETPKDGSVKVTLPTDAKAGDTVEITYTPEGSDQPTTAVITKGEDGTWTSNDPNVVVDGDKATIPADKVADGSTVTAVAKDPAGNSSSEDIGTVATPGAPVVTIPENADGGINAKELADGVQTNVTLPTGTQAGDTVTLTVTNPDGRTSTVTHQVTAEEVATGSAEVTIPKDQIKADGDYKVVADVAYSDGSKSPVSAVADFKVDTTVPGDTNGDGTADTAPVVTIPEAADGVNAKELEDGVQTNVTLPTGTQAGDTVTLTVTNPDGSTSTVTHTVTDAEVTEGSAEVTIPKAQVPTDGEYSVVADIKDAAGNSSLPSTPVTFNVDKTVPGDTNGDGTADTAPVVTIPEATDGVNAKELEDGVQTNVTLPTGTQAGDIVTLTVTNPDNSTSTVTHTVTEAEVTAGSAEVTIPKAQVPTDGQYSVVADIKDATGNSSLPSTPVTFNVDKTVPGDTDGDGTADTAPVVTIPEATDGVNAKELEDGVQTNVTLPTGTQAGDTVTLTVTNPDGSTSTVTHTVTDAEVTAGSADVTIPKAQVPTDGEYSVVADIKDAAGNSSLPSTPVTFNVDKTVPGDTDGDGTADTAPVVTIPEATDGVNAKELEDGVQTNVTLPTGTQAGDIVTLTVTNPDNSTSTVTHTVTEAEVTAGSAEVTIPKEQVPTDGQYSVVADIKDAAGNSSLTSAPATFDVDKTIPGDTDGDGVVDSKPTVTIPEATDGVNKDELENGVQTEVTIPKGTEAGDTVVLTVTNPDGTTSTVTHTVTQAEIDSGKADVTIPKDQIGKDGDYQVTAEIKDPAGNTSGTGDVANFTVDTTAPAAPTVTPSTTDGSVTITPPADADTKSVTVSFTDEQDQPQTVKVVKNADGTWAIDGTAPTGVTVDPATGVVTLAQDAVKDGSTVTATASDTAGNPSTPATGTAGEDSPITIDTVAGDDVINAAEAKAGVTVTGTALPGQEIVLTDAAGNELGTATTGEDGKWSVPLTADQVKAMGEGAETLTATVKDTETATTRNITVDTVVPGDSDGDGVADDAGAPKVAIQDGDDGFINPKDLNEDGTANVTITFPADSGYQAGDVLTVTNPDGSTQTVTLTADDIANGVTVKVTPIDGQVNEVKAVVKDAAGNTSTEGTDTSTADLKVPGDTDGDGTADTAPVVTIPEATDGVNAKELEDGVQTNVTLPTGTQAGDIVTLTVTNPDNSTSTVTHTVTEAEVTAGSAEVTIPKEQVPTDGQYSVVADIKDAAGNSSLTSAPATFDVDKTIPGDTDGDGVVDSTPTVTIPEATDGVNKDELENGVQTEVTIPKGTEAGDTVVLTVTNPDGTTSTVTHTVTQAEIDSGKADVTIPKDQIGKDGDYQVTAEIKDPAGNTSGTGDVANFTVDTTAPAAPTVTPSTTDGSVTITPPADADTKSVTVSFTDEQDQPQTVKVVKNADGTWAIDGTAPTGVTVDPATGVVTLAQDAVKDGSTVTATASDTAGNPSTPAEGTAGSDAVLASPSLAIKEATDGVNAEEAKDGVQVQVTLPEGVAAGDVVTLTVTKPDGTTTTVTHTVTAEEAAAKATEMTVPAADVASDGAYKTTATVTSGNNVSAASNVADFTVDQTAPATPVITPATDGSVTVAPPADADVKTVTVNYKDETGADKQIVATKDDNGVWTIPAEAQADGVTIAEDGTITIPANSVLDQSEVTATASDKAGNVSDEAKATTNIDAVEGKPELTIAEAADGYINAKELADDVQTSVKLPTGTIAGAVITLTVTDANGKTSEVTHTVTADEATAGSAAVVIPKANFTDGAYTVGVSLQQGAAPAVKGNDVAFTVDTGVPGGEDSNNDGKGDEAPVITFVEDTNSDGLLNSTEVGGDGKTTVKIAVPAGTAVGDTLIVTINDVATEVPVTAEILANGYTTEVPVTNGEKITVTASVQDAAGNESAQASKEATVDIAAPTISINPISDGFINAAEAKGDVAISGTTTAEAGQTVTVTLNGKEYTAVVKDNGTWTATVPAADVAALAQGDQAVTANVSDKAGNPATQATANVVVDTVLPTLTVDVADTISATNASAVPVSGTSDLPNGSEVKITLTDADGNTVTVTAKVTDGKYETTVDASGLKDGAITATASSTATDEAGNAPADATDTTANSKDSSAPTLSIDPISEGYINAAEAKGDVAISGTTTAEAGQTVTVTLNGKEYTAVVADNGTWTATVPAADVAALTQGEQAVTANVSDKAGNPATQATANVVVDTVLPTLTVDVADTINATNASAVPVSGASDLPNGSEVNITLTDAEGNTVTVTAKVTDGKYETTVDASGLKDGAITATASSTATDEAGNAPADATDTTANSKDSSAPTLSIDPISE
ncbi:beta strand repeat-containing protein, partial [Testudinibacter sp. TR-2022]|uniref:beta strand repeat-containing protein n=2 Tax=Testudinibacter sp. TR-2022 TaxID=2585029 RepID=UPI001119A35E